LPLVRAKACAAATALLALSACSTTPKTAVLPPVPTPPPTTANVVTTPPPPPTTAPSTTIPTSPATTGPTPTGPTALPPTAAATGPTLTAEQAYAMVRRAYDAYALALQTRDTTVLASAVGPGCNSLSTARKTVQLLRSKHQLLRGEGYVGLRVKDFSSSRYAVTVAAFYEVAAGEIVDDADGKVVETLTPRGQFQDAVTLQRDGRRWYVANISTLTAGAAKH